MNNNTKIAVLKAGIVPTSTLAELERWGMEIPKVELEPDRREALMNIRESIESRETVTLRTTDLDSLKTYQKDSKVGRLYYSVPAPTRLDPKARKTTFIEVNYAMTPAGAYLIPWTDEDIFDLMLDEDTYLKPVGAERIYFGDIADLYYGQQKVFMYCTPAVEEKKKP